MCSVVVTIRGPALPDVAACFKFFVMYSCIVVAAVHCLTLHVFIYSIH